jgi:lipopolysaccharide assembly outer membrane protein LptD (OstA)
MRTIVSFTNEILCSSFVAKVSIKRKFIPDIFLKKRYCLQAIPILLLILSCLYGHADTVILKPAYENNYFVPPDTIPPDTLVTDTTKKDTLGLKNIKQSADTLDAPVKYKATDTIWYDLSNQRVYLLGDAQVQYKDITLTADSIIFDWKNNQVIALGRKDTAGKLVNNPTFEQGDKKYSAREIHYNFKTKKGKISEILTQEGEGYIRSETVKRLPNEVLFGAHNIYTTCNLEHPHFFIASSKIKVIPGKAIVTGPANLVVADVPTPLFVPFGIFPLNATRKSGIIFPEYGEDQVRGYFLRGGGYYFGISDHMDLALTGDIYSRGTWLTNVATRFNKRYKFTGSMNMTYADYRNYNVENNTYASNKEFNFRANWSQDSKARPNSRFNANVAFGSSGFNQQFASTTNLSYLDNTYQSSISYSQTIPYSPFYYTISASHSQSTITHVVNLSLPVVSFNMNPIYPFRRAEAIGNQRWYERIQLSYNMNAQNRISAIDSVFFTPRTFTKFQTGIQHSIPVSAPFQVLKYFTVTPSFNYSEAWALQTTRQSWNPDSEIIEIDTVNGFATTRDFNFGVSSSTRLYGMLKFRQGKVKAIRHVLTPSVGFSFHPDFADPRWNTFETVQYTPEGLTRQYSIFQYAVYTGPGAGRFGGINFSLGNNLEMKVFSKKDTVSQTKKVPLLDALTIGASYNLAVDSLNWSIISIAGRTKLFDKVDINFGSHFDPYIADSFGQRLSQYEWDVNHRIARLTDANVGMGVSFQSKETTQPPPTPEQKQYMISSGNEYADFSIAWNMDLRYNLFLRKVNTLSGNDSVTFTQTLGITASFNLTKNWRISGSTSYDFINHEFPTAALQIYRDLHCWEMSMQWVPFGIRPSYSFILRVKASVLQDLKIPKSKGWNEF